MRNAELKWTKLQDSRLLRMLVIRILAIALGVAIGEFSATGAVSVESLLVATGALLGLLLLSQNRTIKLLPLQRTLLYLTIIAGFTGSAFLTIPIGPIHLFPYRILLPLLWLLFAISLFFNQQGRMNVSHIKVKPYLGFLAFWVLYAVSSLAWAAAKGDAIRDIVFLFMGVSVIFFVAYYFREVRDLQRFYWLWIGVFGLLLLLGLWEHLTGQHLPVSGYYAETRARFMFRPTGVFINPNDYATFLALSIPFALGALRYARNGLVRLIGLGGAAAAFYLIVVTGSRANMLAVLLELAFLVLLLTNLRQKAKVAVAATVCLAVALFLFPGPVQEFAAEFTGGLSSLATQAELGTGSVAVRTNLARNGLAFLYSTAGFGVGAGNAEHWMANFGRYDTAGLLNPHNSWLEILTNYGIFVFVGYLVFYSSLVRQLWRTWRTSDRGGTRMIAEALLVALVGFLVASISSSSIMALKPQWLLIAFALAFLNCWRRSQARDGA